MHLLAYVLHVTTSSVYDWRRIGRAASLGIAEWQPRLFRKVHPTPGGSEEGEEGLEWIINADM